MSGWLGVTGRIPGSTRIGEPQGAEAYRIVRREGPSRASAAIGAAARRRRRGRACSARSRRTLAGRASERDALVQLDELGERRDREALVLVDVALPGEMAEHEGLGRAAVEQAERRRRSNPGGAASPALRPRGGRPPRSIPSSTSCSEAPAMKSATTASTEITQPAIADARLAGGHELARGTPAVASRRRARARRSSPRSRSRSRP